MARIETWFNQDLKQAVKVRYIDGNVFSADNAGNVVGVNVFDDGQPATLGGSVSGSIIRADGVTVAVVGTLSGNKVSVVLPQAAYVVPGVISIVIKLTSGTDVTTLCAVVSNVYMSSTDSIVDPGTIIPSVQTLIAEIEAAVASIPADYSSLWTSLAPEFNSSKIGGYSVGEYCVYNGSLWVCKTAHTGTWDSNHFDVTNLGENLFYLSKAVENDEKRIYSFGAERSPSAVANGWKLIQNSGLCSSDGNYKLVKYAVTAGKLVKIVTNGLFQFQIGASVPASGTSSRVGMTYNKSSFVYEVPATANYLIVSVLMDGGVSSVYDATDNIEDNSQQIQGVRDELSVNPDSLFNQLSPIQSITSGLKWDSGVVKNSMTDTKDYLMLKCETINSSGTATQVGNTINFTEPGTAKFVAYCYTTTKYIQFRHNGTVRDLYIRFPLNLERDCEVIISLNVDAVNASVIGGLQLSNMSAVIYAENLLANSIDNLHHLNIPNDAIPYFSQTSSNFTTQIKIGESDTFTNLPETGKTRTPAQVVADIPDNATYANGMLTIQMALTQSLFYDYENNKFIVSYTGSSGLPEKNCIVLVSSYYGNIHGDWVDHAAYRNEFLKPSAYLGNGNGFSYTNRTNGTVDIYITTSISFVLSNGSTVSFNKEDIVAQLGSSAVIEGDAVKITLGTYKGLFYNAITGALFISSTGASGNGIIPLLFNAWTNLYGSFLQFYIRNKITEHDTQIDAIDKYIKLPSYYVDEINDTANKLSKLPGTNFNYLVLTDIHYSYPSEFTQTKLKQLMESVNQLGNGTNIDAVLFLGDIIEGGSTANRETSDNQINEMLGGLRNIRKPVLCLFGNHDNNMYDFSYSSAEPCRNTDHYITMGEWKNKAVYPFGIDNDYYCVDFPKKNMRVIVTNTCDYQESVDSQGNVTIADYHEIMIRHNQLDAIAGMLLESAYDSVVFAHGLPTALFQLISEYNTRGSWTKENGEVVSFANVTHKVVLYHTGHYHNNAIEYNSGYNVNIISTSCTCMAHVQQTLYSRPPTNIVTSWEDISDNYPILYNERVIPRISNTINETCMDIVSIGNGKINKIGFGAAFDGTLNIV